jgi:hypothetical protein
VPTWYIGTDGATISSTACCSAWTPRAHEAGPRSQTFAEILFIGASAMPGFPPRTKQQKEKAACGLLAGRGVVGGGLVRPLQAADGVPVRSSSQRLKACLPITRLRPSGVIRGNWFLSASLTAVGMQMPASAHAERSEINAGFRYIGLSCFDMTRVLQAHGSVWVHMLFVGSAAPILGANSLIRICD